MLLAEDKSVTPLLDLRGSNSLLVGFLRRFDEGVDAVGVENDAWSFELCMPFAVTLLLGR
jgi:hypothetical protein